MVKHLIILKSELLKFKYHLIMSYKEQINLKVIQCSQTNKFTERRKWLRVSINNLTQDLSKLQQDQDLKSTTIIFRIQVSVMCAKSLQYQIYLIKNMLLFRTTLIIIKEIKMNQTKPPILHLTRNSMKQFSLWEVQSHLSLNNTLSITTDKSILHQLSMLKYLCSSRAITTNLLSLSLHVNLVQPIEI